MVALIGCGPIKRSPVAVTAAVTVAVAAVAAAVAGAVLHNAPPPPLLLPRLTILPLCRSRATALTNKFLLDDHREEHGDAPSHPDATSSGLPDSSPTPTPPIKAGKLPAFTGDRAHDGLTASQWFVLCMRRLRLDPLSTAPLPDYAFDALSSALQGPALTVAVDVMVAGWIADLFTTLLRSFPDVSTVRAKAAFDSCRQQTPDLESHVRQFQTLYRQALASSNGDFTLGGKLLADKFVSSLHPALGMAVRPCQPSALDAAIQSVLYMDPHVSFRAAVTAAPPTVPTPTRPSNVLAPGTSCHGPLSRPKRANAATVLASASTVGRPATPLRNARHVHRAHHLRPLRRTARVNESVPVPSTIHHLHRKTPTPPCTRLAYSLPTAHPSSSSQFLSIRRQAPPSTYPHW